MSKKKKEAELSDETRDTVYRMYTRGAMPETMAATFGLELAQVEAVINERLEALPPLEAKTPERNVQEHFVKVRAMIDELAVAAAKAKGNEKVAAVRVKYEAERYLFDLQRELLLVPRSLGTMAMERDLREIGKQLIAWAEGFVPEEMQAEVFMQLADVIEFGGRDTGVLEAG